MDNHKCHESKAKVPIKTVKNIQKRSVRNQTSDNASNNSSENDDTLIT